MDPHLNWENWRHLHKLDLFHSHKVGTVLNNDKVLNEQHGPVLIICPILEVLFPLGADLENFNHNAVRSHDRNGEPQEHSEGSSMNKTSVELSIVCYYVGVVAEYESEIEQEWDKHSHYNLLVKVEGA